MTLSFVCFYSTQHHEVFQMGPSKSKFPTLSLYHCSREIRRTICLLASGHSVASWQKSINGSVSRARTEERRGKFEYLVTISSQLVV